MGFINAGNTVLNLDMVHNAEVVKDAEGKGRFPVRVEYKDGRTFTLGFPRLVDAQAFLKEMATGHAGFKTYAPAVPAPEGPTQA